jgi:hypothetical protein
LKDEGYRIYWIKRENKDYIWNYKINDKNDDIWVNEWMIIIMRILKRIKIIEINEKKKEL